jgi:hypothetical protein
VKVFQLIWTEQPIISNFLPIKEMLLLKRIRESCSRVVNADWWKYPRGPFQQSGSRSSQFYESRWMYFYFHLHLHLLQFIQSNHQQNDNDRMAKWSMFMNFGESIPASHQSLTPSSSYHFWFWWNLPNISTQFPTDYLRFLAVIRLIPCCRHSLLPISTNEFR